MLMKILFVDPLNTQNNFYTYAKYLRTKGIEAHLLIGQDIGEDKPSWRDPSLAGQDTNPYWVKTETFPRFSRMPLQFLKRYQALITLLKTYDLIVCSGKTPVWVQWAGKPFIFLSYGSDLDQLAVQGWTGSPADPVSPKIRLVGFFLKYFLRQALRKAKVVILSPYQISTARRFGLKRLSFLPHIIDTDLFSPYDTKAQAQVARQKLRQELDCDLIMFHPTRHVWRHREVADCKGNDKLLAAFAEFVKREKVKAKLVMIEKGWDLEYSKELVAAYGLERNVVWKAAMPSSQLVDYYRAADMVFDQFAIGVFALVAVEGMACGQPTFSYVNRGDDNLFYAKMPPVVNVCTTEEILNHMCDLAHDEDKREDIGRQSREWIVQHCYWETAIEKHIGFYQKVLSD